MNLPKVNTRAILTFLTPFLGSLGVTLHKLDPNNFQLALAETISLAGGLGCGALLAFFNTLFPLPKNESSSPSQARSDSP